MEGIDLYRALEAEGLTDEQVSWYHLSEATKRKYERCAEAMAEPDLSDRMQEDFDHLRRIAPKDTEAAVLVTDGDCTAFLAREGEHPLDGVNGYWDVCSESDTCLTPERALSSLRRGCIKPQIQRPFLDAWEDLTEMAEKKHAFDDIIVTVNAEQTWQAYLVEESEGPEGEEAWVLVGECVGEGHTARSALLDLHDQISVLPDRSSSTSASTKKAAS
jgi:hypothetical protein